MFAIVKQVDACVRLEDGLLHERVDKGGMAALGSSDGVDLFAVKTRGDDKLGVEPGQLLGLAVVGHFRETVAQEAELLDVVYVWGEVVGEPALCE